MSNAAPKPPADAKAPANPNAVIRRVKGAEESAQQRLLKKHIPAWVISGAVHVALIMTLIMVDKWLPKAEAAPASEELLTVVTDEKPAEEPKVDLTNPDIGLEPELPSAVDVNNLAEVNVMKDVVPDTPVGVPDEVATKPIDVNPTPGVGAADATLAGLDAGDTGNVMSGVGTGGTGAFANAGFNGRSGASRNRLVATGGGNSASEAAVARGLIWLAKQQKSNGSWVYDGSSPDEVIAATGMALLPFLAAGNTHKPFKENKYQKTVDAGLKFLVSQMKPNGSFNGAKTMYAHGIATVALCEAYGMTGDKSRLLVPAQKAVAYCAGAQGPNGSWGYGPNANGDTSIVGWQIQGLHSGKLCKDIIVPKNTMDKSRDFLNLVSDEKTKSRYGYADRNSPSPTRSAIGLLCRYYVDGWGPNNQSMASGVKYLLESRQPADGALDMYYYYYATQVMHFYDGPEWHKIWNPKMRDLLVKKQVPEDKTQAGSWDPDSSTIGSHCGRLGTTCLCLLTLEVYYRHLPLYKRDTAGMAELERNR